MSLYEVICLAIILSADAFCVSLLYGLCPSANPKNICIKIAFGTGLFQFLMPLAGAYCASFLFEFIENYAQYIAGIIFIILGIKLFIESYKKDSLDCADKIDISWKILLSISVATSIDALAAGSSLYLLKAPVFISSSIIGFITFINSVAGFCIGKFSKKYTPDILEKIGSILLILLGLKSILL